MAAKKPRVYLESTIPSYLTARPSRDIVRAAEQEVTRAWWEGRARFELFVSVFVLDEIGAGDTAAARLRVASVADVALLAITREGTALADELIRRGAVPRRAAVDAIHIALAAVHGVDYLLTWNCKHIANAAMRGKIEGVCRRRGVEPPVICTRMELFEE